jgi:2-C-methyl-D-erythritol 4-phosphate cytidylyltransferase
MSSSEKGEVTKITETISGMLPLKFRTKLAKLMDNASVIVCESSRAIARKASVAEDLYQLAKERGVQIIASDLPDLYKHDCNPAESFMRKVIFASQDPCA